jgi:hypothetical protein
MSATDEAARATMNALNARVLRELEAAATRAELSGAGESSDERITVRVLSKLEDALGGNRALDSSGASGPNGPCYH